MFFDQFSALTQFLMFFKIFAQFSFIFKTLINNVEKYEQINLKYERKSLEIIKSWLQKWTEIPSKKMQNADEKSQNFYDFWLISIYEIIS